MRVAWISAVSIVVVMVCGVGELSAAQWLDAEQYGDGSDAALSVSSNTTEAPVDASCWGSVSTTSLSATHTSFAADQVILIHQTRGTGAGNWELNVINSYTPGTITTKYALANTYTDGGSSQAQVRVLRQYSSVTIDNGVTWTAKAWDGDTGGILAFLCNGTVTVNGSMSASAKGFRKNSNAVGTQLVDVTGVTGESSIGAGGSRSRTANGSGGGGGSGSGTGKTGGGGGGHGASGANGLTDGDSTAYGYGGSTDGAADLTNLVFGGAGGAGAIHSVNNGAGTGGEGGYGGGTILIIAKEVLFTGTAVSSGSNGGNAGNYYAAGGGGAGGAVLIIADDAALGVNRITVAAGSGGAAGGLGYTAGGSGGVGRIALHYGTSYSGSSNPTVTVVQDDMYIANKPPTSFSLSAPADQSSTSDSTPTLSWQASTDPESLPVTYILKIDTAADFAEPIYRMVSGLSNTSYTPAVGQELANGTYYWKVTAFDGEMFTDSTETRQVTINAAAPSVPTVTGVLSNAETGKIVRIIGAADSSGGQSLTVRRKDSGGTFNSISGITNWDGDHWTFDPDTPLDSGSVVDVLAGSSPIQSRVSVLSFANTLDVFLDTSTFYDTGNSMRMEKDTSYEFKITANGGSAVTVNARMRYNSAYGSSGAPLPMITLTGSGIGGTGAATDTMGAAANTWEQLSVTGTPTSDGVLTLTVETYSAATGSAAWIDAFSVSQ